MVDDGDEDEACIASLVLEYVARARRSNRHEAHRQRRDLIMTCSVCEQDVFASQYFAHMTRRHHHRHHHHHGGRRSSRTSKSDVPPSSPNAGAESPRAVHRERETQLAHEIRMTNTQRSGIDRPTFASLVRRLVALLPSGGGGGGGGGDDAHATATVSATNGARATASPLSQTLMSASADAATTAARSSPPPPASEGPSNSSSGDSDDAQRGDFVDIGSGAGNVVSYVSLVSPRAFATVHAIDLEQDSAVVEEVHAMQKRVPEHATVKWWSTDGESDILIDFDEDACDRARSIADILKDASLIYCADHVFEDAAVKLYRRAIAHALRPGRAAYYVTFKPIGPRTLRRAKRDVWIPTPGGTSDAHIGQFVRAVMVTTAQGGKDVAWETCSVYAVRLLREATERRMTQ